MNGRFGILAHRLTHLIKRLTSRDVIAVTVPVTLLEIVLNHPQLTTDRDPNDQDPNFTIIIIIIRKNPSLPIDSTTLAIHQNRRPCSDVFTLHRP